MQAKSFMDQDFLLSTNTAKKCYHEWAERLPVLDYHCHINPEDIALDRKFDTITQVWLGGDHYKWRQMRANGVAEEYITGRASDREKFQKWAETLPMAIGNPLYHWSHLELKRYFGYDGCLNGDTAEEVWNLCNQKLKEDSTSVRNLIRRCRVRLLCTTDDPSDELKWHQAIAADPYCELKVLPTWRPDRAMNMEKPDFPKYMWWLGETAGMKIDSFEALKEALGKRMDYFQSMGCLAADHGLEYVPFAPASLQEVEQIFAKRLAEPEYLPDRTELDQFKTAFLLFCGQEYSRRGWVMQIHYGCKRNNNRRMYEKLGPDTGFDCIGGRGSTNALTNFMNCLEYRDTLPKTIIYSLNPNDDTAIGTIIGCFQSSAAGIPGKIQHGSAWWFNDNQRGMAAQMTNLANQGLLGNFIGMLTDSRSFVSYTRHEYFRRILCDLIGGWVEQGEYPEDWDMLERIIKGICYNNAVRFFGFPVPEET